MKLLDFNSFYLVGIKGVAMTSIAQCILDAGKKVTGTDVEQDFVTKKMLENIGCGAEKINIGFEHNIFNQSEKIDVDCVIYTSAHGGKYNPIVQQAISNNIPTFSQAEALSELFNEKLGIAVCGVGGKSSVSAMIAWIMNKVSSDEDDKDKAIFSPSFSVGVGNIPGLEKTGQWSKKSKFFVAEADEYVTDPAAPSKNIPITPRFSYLNPHVTVCTNLAFDHPDVYRDFDHTKEVFSKFFEQIKPNGKLIVNSDNQELVKLAEKAGENDSSLEIINFGVDLQDDNKPGNNKSCLTESCAQKTLGNDFYLTEYKSSQGKTQGEFSHYKNGTNTEYTLTLQIPGRFNIMNAISAIAACNSVGVDINDSINALKSFNSTMRRFEHIGVKNNITFYDDYAHHPNEVSAAINAFNEWYPDNHKIIAFQSHTYSRTKELFTEFVDAFADADDVVMIDIFPSAREAADMSVSSTLLCEEISKKYPNIKAVNVVNLEGLAKYLNDNLNPGDACLTLGAGDIYEVHELI